MASIVKRKRGKGKWAQELAADGIRVKQVADGWAVIRGRLPSETVVAVFVLEQDAERLARRMAWQPHVDDRVKLGAELSGD